MSLVSAFDNLKREANILSAGIEIEFKTFVENQLTCRRQWAEAEEHAEKLRRNNMTLESDNKALENKLIHARHLIEKEEDKRRKIEQEKCQVEQQITLIRELLADSKPGIQLDHIARDRLAFLSNTALNTIGMENSPVKNRKSMNNQSQHSVLSDEDIDYWDKTEEDVMMSPCQAKRRSKRLSSKRQHPTAPPEEELRITPPKRHKVKKEESEVVTTTTITVTSDGRPIEATTEVSLPNGASDKGVRMMNRSFSEPALDKHLMEQTETESDDPWTPMNNNAISKTASKGSFRGTPTTPRLRKAHSATGGLNRIHVFISETVIRPKTCVPCGKRIGFGRMAMKCKECRSMCHPECKESLPLPCISAPPTPGGTGKIQGGVLSDFCNDESPMIPGIVIHCVNEIEARGLDEVGIYRVPGSDRQVKELKEKFFRGKGMPNLSNIYDIHVICGCLKAFLRDLKEPVVTYKLWEMFVNAAVNRDKAMSECEMYQALSELPRANRDTLAFIMLHLHRVAQTPDCKMPADNLSRVFGPSIVGHSTPEQEPMQLINETKYQAMVMDKLFDVSEDYWINFISDDNENMYAGSGNTPQTPTQSSRNLLASRLGPVHTPGSYERSRTWTSRTAATPSRFADRTTRNVTKKPSHFFASPSVD